MNTNYQLASPATFEIVLNYNKNAQSLLPYFEMCSCVCMYMCFYVDVCIKYELKTF